MMGSKKYDVLKAFQAGKRTDILLQQKTGNSAAVPWDAVDTVILFHLVAMGFVNVSVEKDGLTFQMTEDGRLYLQGAAAAIEHEMGRGAV